MKAEDINLKDYEELFRIDIPVAYYISELFMYHYQKLNCLLLYCNGAWQTLLPKTVFRQLLDEGALFYSDRAAFLKWKNEFDTYMNNSWKFIEKCKTFPSLITKELFEEITKKGFSYRRRQRSISWRNGSRKISCP